MLTIFANIWQRSIMIEDFRDHVLASGQYRMVDKARERCIQLGRRFSDVVQYFIEMTKAGEINPLCGN